jgi:hypothetical protein
MGDDHIPGFGIRFLLEMRGSSDMRKRELWRKEAHIHDITIRLWYQKGSVSSQFAPTGRYSSVAVSSRNTQVVFLGISVKISVEKSPCTLARC